MTEHIKRPNKAARKAAKKAYKQSQTPFRLLCGQVLKAVASLLALTLLGWLIFGLEQLDKFVPVKVNAGLLFLGGVLILFWGYRRFRAKWMDEEVTVGWHLLARFGKSEIFFAVAGLSVMAFSIWHFFNALNFKDTIELVFIILGLLFFKFVMLIFSGELILLAIYGWRIGESWKIIYAVVGLLPVLMVIGLCWVISLALFPENYVMQNLFVLVCATAALSFITYFYLIPAWGKKEKTL